MTEVKSAARALEIIEYLADHGSVRFSDLISDLSLPRSSAHGLLLTLENRGWITTSGEDRKLRLGLPVWQIGQAFDGHRQLVDTAQPVMDELMAEVGETVQLARLDGTENVYIGISMSPHPMRLVSSVGMRLQSHGTGVGKALLSTLSDEEVRRRYRNRTLEGYTPKTITDLDDLIRSLDTARAAGYSIDDEEYADGCICIAMPLTSHTEFGFASGMSVTMPLARSSSEWPSDLIDPLRTAVGTVRERLDLA